jgi:multidrug efflux pump subunit AcrB
MGHSAPFRGDLFHARHRVDRGRLVVPRLGRSEDPDFTVKTMVVQVGWPRSATVGDTIEQITDRLERKLQETPNLDYLKSYTTAGKAYDLCLPEGLDAPAQVPDIWYQVRKKVADIRHTLPQGHRRPRL